MPSDQEGTVNFFATLDRQLIRNLGILFVAGLFFWSSITSMQPTVPLYVQSLGGSDRQIGLVMGGFAIGLLFSRGWFGWLTDRYSRKMVLSIGTLVAAIAPLGYLLTNAIPLLMGVRIFHGVSIAAFSTAYSALIADLAPPQHRGQLIGYMTLVTPLGFATGPIVGGFVQAEYGNVVFFCMAAGLGLVSLIFMANSRDSDRSTMETSSSSNASSENIWSLLGSRKIFTPTLVLFMAGLIFGTVTSFIPLYMKATEIDLNPGWFFTTAAIGSFSMRVLCGQASDRFGRGVFLSLAWVFYLVSMLFLWQGNTSQLFLLAALTEGAAAGILLPLTIALVSDRSYPQQRGRTFSLCIGSFDLGVAIAGPLLGSIAQEFGYRQAFGIDFAIAVVALLVFVTQNSKNLLHSWRFAIGQERDLYALPSEGGDNRH